MQREGAILKINMVLLCGLIIGLGHFLLCGGSYNVLNQVAGK